ncbi:MAG: FtsX-like permease family protein [Gammaproteobacteria bacterium]|nr:FtsX-like permease family protein [Gammaproteobacteria bacterium]
MTRRVRALRSWRLALRGLSRDWLSGELGILSIALVVAVAAMTAIGFFTDRVGQAMDREASGVLAADLVVSSRRELDEAWLAAAAEFGLDSAQTMSFPSVVLFGESSTLVEVRAVSERYPLRGELRVRDDFFAPAGVADTVPRSTEAWADPRLLARLDAAPGARLSVGAADISVSRLLDHVPDRGWRFVDLAPTLLINIDDVPATELVQPGSRVSYQFLFAGDRSDVQQFRDWIKPQLSEGQRLLSLDDAQPEIRRALDRARRFLGLAAIVAVLLSGVAIAMSARHYVARHLDLAALMKCLGAKQRDILRLNLAQLAMLAILAATLGSLLGYLAQAALVSLVGDLVASELPSAGPQPAALGFATALLLLTGFALPSLLQLRRTPPARVLRHDLAPPPVSNLLLYAGALLALGALLAWLVRNVSLMLWIGLGAAMTTLLLMLAGWGLVSLTGRLRGRVGVSWRYGLANIARRGRDSVVQVTAFGLSLMVLLLLGIVRNDLLEGWQATLPEKAPNHFLINIQPDETDALREFFIEQNVPVPELVPLVRARLRALNDVPVDGQYEEGSRAERFVNREANLSYSARLPLANKVTAGQFWRPEATAPEVSVEEEFAESLGIAVGDSLTFDIAGETLTATVSSLRSVDWDSFQPNFFMLFTPSTLEGFPATFISSIYIDESQRPVLLSMIKRFPSVTSIDMAAILNQVRSVIDKAALAVKYVFAFTLLAGLMVLMAAIQTTRDERRYEAAMLRTFGARKSVVFAGLASEFIMLGMLAGALGAFGASLCGALLATQVFDLPLNINPAVWLTGIVAGILLVGISGTLATRNAVSQSPVTVLRKT